MRALLQRVTQAEVTVLNEETGVYETRGKIGPGFCVLLGVGPDDTRETAQKLMRKILGLRVFDDQNRHMNLSIKDIDGGLLIVSQFTLYANSRRGMRPSFTDAAKPPLARELYEYACELARAEVPCGTGVFAAEMQVSLVNDGPVTIWLDTDEL